MNERRFYVYEYYITSTGEIFYVGKGTGDRYKTIKGRNKFFTDMYNSHNCDVRFFSTDLTEEEAYRIEFLRIQFLRKYTPFRLTNQTDGGDGTRGFKPSPEHIEKCRQAVLARWADPIWKQSQIEARRAPESVFQSEKFKSLISQKVSGTNNPNYGHKWTKDMKEAASKQKRESGRYIGGKNPMSKKVQCIETGEVFETMEDAAERYGLKSGTSISHALKSKSGLAAGFHWKLFSE